MNHLIIAFIELPISALLLIVLFCINVIRAYGTKRKS